MAASTIGGGPPDVGVLAGQVGPQPLDHLGDQPGLAVPVTPIGWHGQRRHVRGSSVVPAPTPAARARSTGRPRVRAAVEVGGLPTDCHGRPWTAAATGLVPIPAPPPTKTSSRVVALAQGEHPERAAQVQPVTDLELVGQVPGEQPVRVHLDHELQAAVLRLEVLAMENDRCSPVPGTAMSMYCPGKNLISLGSTSRSTRCRMSWVTGSFAITSATASTIGRPDRIISSS